jgi:hypothetical protein
VWEVVAKVVTIERAAAAMRAALSSPRFLGRICAAGGSPDRAASVRRTLAST